MAASTTRVVFRFDVTIDGDGTVATYYFTTRGFRTLATDTPANTYIAERVATGGAGSYTRSLFGQNGMTGAITSSKGLVKLNNEDGGLDDFARFASSGGDVTAYLGDDSMAFPGGYFQLYASQIKAVVADFDIVTVQQRDRSEAFNQPIVTATFAGSGGLEGTVTAARKKQLVFGAPGLVSPILLDPLKQIYYLQANATDQATLSGLTEFGHVFGGGVPSSRGEVYVFESDLLSETDPDPGEYRLWSGYEGSFRINNVVIGSQAEANVYCKGPIYFRLGTPPTADLKFGAVGMLQNRTSETPRAWRFSDLCNRAGLSDVTPYTMAAINGQVEDFDVGNRLIDGDQTFMEVMNDRCKAVNGSFGFDRLDRFFCVTLQGPESGADSSVFTFTVDNDDAFSRQPIAGMERPIWQVHVKSGRTSASASLESASTEMQDLLARDGYYVEFAGSSPGVREAYPNAMSVSLEIDGNDFKSQELQRAFIDQFGALHGTRRDFVSLTCKRFDTTTLAIGLHDKVTLQVARFGYDAGVLFRVVTITVNLDEPSLSFVLWGNNSGFYPVDLGGGNFPAGAGDPGGSWGGGQPPAGTAMLEDELSVFDDFDIQFFISTVAEAFAEFEIEDFAVDSDTTVEAGAPATDPDFASVALLAPLTAAGTTIADLSSYASGSTGDATRTISASDTVVGGGGALFITTPDNGGLHFANTGGRFNWTSGEIFTIEGFYKRVSNSGSGSASIRPRLFMWPRSENWDVVCVRDVPGSGLALESQSTYYSIADAAYHYVCVLGMADDTLEFWVDGTLIDTALPDPHISPYATLDDFYLAGGFNNTGLDTPAIDCRMGQWRFTRGVHRDPTVVPTAPFPTS